MYRTLVELKSANADIVGGVGLEMMKPPKNMFKQYESKSILKTTKSFYSKNKIADLSIDLLNKTTSNLY